MTRQVPIRKTSWTSTMSVGAVSRRSSCFLAAASSNISVASRAQAWAMGYEIFIADGSTKLTATLLAEQSWTRPYSALATASQCYFVFLLLTRHRRGSLRYRRSSSSRDHLPITFQ